MDVTRRTTRCWVIIALLLAGAAANATEVIYSTDLGAEAAFASDRQIELKQPTAVRTKPAIPAVRATEISDQFVRPAAAAKFTRPTPTPRRTVELGGLPGAAEPGAAKPGAAIPGAAKPQAAGRLEVAGPSQSPPTPVTRPLNLSTPQPARRPTEGGLRVARFDASTPQAAPEPPTTRTTPTTPLAADEVDQLVNEPLIDPTDQLLLTAHQLSLSADAGAAYTEIARLCAEALRDCKHAENRAYGSKLAAWALNRRGESRLDDDELELAMADFETAISLDPEAWRPLHNRSVLHARASRFAEAFDDVTRVIELHPDFAKAYSNRATLYVQAGLAEQALADYESALAIDDSLAAARVGAGRVSHMLGRLEEALEHFDEAIRLTDQAPETLCSRADLHADLGNYAEALGDYARAIEADPEFAHAYRNGAWLLATCPDERFRDVENALYGARQVLEYNYGERHAALDTLAAALANAGKFEMAVEVIQEAIELAPADAQAAYSERLALYEQGQPFRTGPVE